MAIFNRLIKPIPLVTLPELADFIWKLIYVKAVKRGRQNI